jgi:hypothetical protein
MVQGTRTRGALAATAIACACLPARELSVGVLGTTGGANTTAGDGSLATASSTASPSDTGMKLDVAADTGTAGEAGGDVGCEKADFLFVIDNSQSMEDEQDNLIASFAGFISTIQATLRAQDYHIIVVDTDATGATGGMTIECVNGVCTCEPVPGCCEQACNIGGVSCNEIPCDRVPGGECDRTLGAGKVFRSDGTLCMHETPRYMSGSDEDLGDTFACVAEVGTFGAGDEQPMAAMLLAVDEGLAGTGGCNDGFLRSDAILVVTFITDEEDVAKSPGDPTSWHADLVAAKQGSEDAVVVLGLFGDTDRPDALCEPLDMKGGIGAEAGVRLREFVEGFGEHGVIGSVCADDYTPFFEQAVQIIDTACDEFVPPP